MIFDPLEKNPGARLLFILACLVVVVYGLKFAAPILLPSALALFLAVLSLPIMMWQLHRGVPKVIATLVTVLVFVGGVGLLILIGSQSVSELQNNMEGYVEGLSTRTSDWTDRAEAFTGLEIGDYIANDVINPAVFAGVLGDTIGRIAQFLGTTFLVFLIMAFMLGEAAVFPDKFRYVLGVDDGDQDRLTKVVTEVQSYLGIKTIVSLVTGITLGLWAYMLNLDFPLLLGMVAFLLNYVPTVGSIIAAIPAVILSIILFGTVAHAFLVALGYVAVNMILGNIIEPTLMGRRLGLSTLVVILSLVFWYWAWGPVGAILSVPLTVVLKIWLENTEDLRWVAILLDKKPPVLPATAAESHGGD